MGGINHQENRVYVHQKVRIDKNHHNCQKIAKIAYIKIASYFVNIIQAFSLAILVRESTKFKTRKNSRVL